MFSSLKKHGLSDTVHQLKSHISNSASRVSHQMSSKAKKTQANSVVSKFQLLSEDHTHKNYTILEVLIDLISNKERESCTIKQHEFNATKYLCLQESCAKKLGCSYCFLESHKMHAKIETCLCLKDLTELKEKVDENKAKMKEELKRRKTQVTENIRREISKIREEFNSSLDYLNNKIFGSLQKEFNERLCTLEKYNVVTESKQESRKSESMKAKQQNTFKDLEFQQILQAFNNGPSRDVLLMSHLQKTSGITKHKTAKKQQFCIYDLSKNDELVLLSKLQKLNLLEIEQYLKHQLEIVQNFCQCLNIFSEYYVQISASLSEFLATFKRAIPSCPSLQNRLNEPEILKVFSV